MSDTVEQIIQGLAGLRDTWLGAYKDFYMDYRSTAETFKVYADELDAELVLLREKLGRVLEAGQAMRHGIGSYAVALNAIPFKQADTCSAIRDCVDGLRSWDAALAELDLPAGAGRGEGQP